MSTTNDETIDFDDNLTFGSIDASYIKDIGNNTRELNNVDDNKIDVSHLLSQETDNSSNVLRIMNDGKQKRNTKGPRWGAVAPSRTTQMTLKEQERVIDEIKKENFSLKMKVYFLEERLSKLGPDEMERALKE
ncbi:7490_t:CDS:2, partial [Acaulospora colombiana]